MLIRRHTFLEPFLHKPELINKILKIYCHKYVGMPMSLSIDFCILKGLYYINTLEMT